jgi:ferrous iron transport protein B
VARDILLAEEPYAVVHVIDARNLERMLPMTLQLIETGLPVMLVVNIMDEAEALGMSIDIPLLQGSSASRSSAPPPPASAVSRRSGRPSPLSTGSGAPSSAMPRIWSAIS